MTDDDMVEVQLDARIREAAKDIVKGSVGWNANEFLAAMAIASVAIIQMGWPGPQRDEVLDGYRANIAKLLSEIPFQRKTDA